MQPARLVLAVALVAAGAIACAPLAPRFPADVQAAIARDDMRRMETSLLVVYYPAHRRALAERMATRIEACAAVLRRAARVDNRHSREKLIVVVPEAPFNNAYAMPPVGGTEDHTVIPTGDTLDFVSGFGLPPDPGMTGCHEIAHYVHGKQIEGAWGLIDTVFGSIATPQGGFEPWFFEGLATYYEARLQPGVGRPRWPTFTSAFHAAYAGGAGIGRDALSEYARLASAGHHYLVGTAFVSWLAATYGEDALWQVIELQASSVLIVTGVDRVFARVYGKDVDGLLAEFRAWVAATYPARTRPDREQVIARLGTDVRWAWAEDGSTAVVDADVDRATRLVVRDAAGRVRDDVALVDVVPPRTLAVAAPILVTGLGFTRDGAELWLTAIDLGDTFQETRLLRMKVGSGVLEEVARELGSGGAIAPDGRTYYALAGDGDRWSVHAYDVGARRRRIVWDAPPGRYALRLAVSPGGDELAVSVWDGTRFAIWRIDAVTGARRETIVAREHGPVYDPSYAPDGRLVFLEEIDARFQVAVAEEDGTRTIATDAPYGAVEPRVVGDRLRFLARDGWRWTLDEVPLPDPVPVPVPETEPVPVPVPESVPVPGSVPVPESVPVSVISDEPYSRLDGLFLPTLRAPLYLDVAPNQQVGFVLGGGDRLGFVRWSAMVLFDTYDGRASGSVGVLEHGFAPWTIAAFADRAAFRERVLLDDDTTADLDRETRGAAVSIGRTWRESFSVQLAGRYLWDRFEGETLRLYGPSLGFWYGGFEATPYGGARRGLAVDGAAAYYPRSVPADLIDVGGGVTAIAPLPFGQRHALRLSGRGRALLRDRDRLLGVGGITSDPKLWGRPEASGASPGLGLLPSGAVFAEALRGFEDLTLDGSRAAIVELAWRYPLIFDRGTSGTWLFPPTFVRQLDLELFGSAAWIAPGDARLHQAAGASAALRLVTMRLPLRLRYQIARRFTDDRAWTQLVTLGVEL